MAAMMGVMAINTRLDIHGQVICANCFIRKGDKYLVLKRSQKKKYAPGVAHPVGRKVDIGENPYTAAVREVREETGLEVAAVRLEAVLLEIEPGAIKLVNIPFSAEIIDYVSGEVKETDEGELVWLTSDEYKKEKLFPSTVLVI